MMGSDNLEQAHSNASGASCIDDEDDGGDGEDGGVGGGPDEPRALQRRRNLIRLLRDFFLQAHFVDSNLM